MTRRKELRRRVVRVLAVLGAAVAVVGVASPRDALAHDLGFDSVDGCEIRAEDETSFDVERSTATIAWEALSGGSCVHLLGDVWNAVADLEWKDAYRDDVVWIGLYEYEFGADDIHQVHTLAVTDLTNDRMLVGLADDVFVATVVRERGRTTGEPLPETQFDVEVVRAVKGSLTGKVVVSQPGEIDARGDTVVVDDDAALEVGRTYLFASLKDGMAHLDPALRHLVR